FSVEAWVKLDDTATDVYRSVVTSRDGDASGSFYGYILYAGPKSPDPALQDAKMYWQAWVGDGTPTWVMLPGPEVQVGLTTYLLLTYDGTPNPGTLTLDAIFPDTIDASVTPAMIDAARVRTAASYKPVPAQPGRPLYIGMGATEVLVPPNLPRYAFRGF